MNNNGKSPLLKNLAIVGVVLTFLGMHLVLVVQMGEMRESIGEVRGDIARLDARMDTEMAALRAEIRGEFARVDVELTAMRADIEDLKNDSREIRNLIVAHIVGHDNQKTAARGDVAARTVAKQ